MADKLTKEVLFNDGEALTHTDLNLLQKRGYAALLDGLIAQLGRVTQGQAGGVPTSHLYCLGNSGAPYNGVAARQSTNLEGTVFQRVLSGDPSGEDPQLLMYYIEADEAGLVHDAAGAGLQRWDLVSVKLEQEETGSVSVDFKDAVTDALSSQSLNKKRRVKATFTVTKGVETASNPALPTTPAGDVKLAAFRVYDGMGVFSPFTDIIDFRMPVLWEEEVTPGDKISTDGSFRVETFGNLGFSSDGGFALLYPSQGMSSKRIVAVVGQLLWDKVPIAGSPLPLYLARADTIAETASNIVDVTPSGFSGTSPEETRLNLSTVTVPNLLMGGISTPVWSNGYSCGYAVDRTKEASSVGFASMSRLALYKPSIRSDLVIRFLGFQGVV